MAEFSEFGSSQEPPCFNSKVASPLEAERGCPVLAKIALGKNAVCTYAPQCAFGDGVPTSVVPQKPRWVADTSRDLFADWKS